MLSVDREKIIDTLRDLPEKTTIEDAMERLFLLVKIEQGIKQADSEQYLAHEMAKEKMKKWLK